MRLLAPLVGRSHSQCTAVLEAVLNPSLACVDWCRQAPPLGGSHHVQEQESRGEEEAVDPNTKYTLYTWSMETTSTLPMS